ncbi:DNA-binding protein [Peptoniphilus sp. MSJ-1]|uniref:DNA-binding protein n=1 Tax=Peptoniphilus ovalis TaxID=2841503 RepID=A0ABS6FE25_9FIRM|nr:PPC domain-containing DNA-binding protein [Peptoniphilus ovalis]MBU5668437.1 DNA-binding protein [Peptoniphilus ovalis]
MDYRRFGNKIVARIDRGEEVQEKLKEIAEKENIKLASISGLGATDDFTIGVYKVNDKSYTEKNFKGIYEILSIIGSISTKDGEYYPHLHISAADDKGNGFGGHLIKSHISVTCELTIDVIDGVVEREINEETGLNVYKFI